MSVDISEDEMKIDSRLLGSWFQGNKSLQSVQFIYNGKSITDRIFRHESKCVLVRYGDTVNIYNVRFILSLLPFASKYNAAPVIKAPSSSHMTTLIKPIGA